MKHRNRARIVVGLLTALAIAGAARPARACGGFFCSTVPVDQSGEQIVFSLQPGHVTAYIQISYSGSAQDFAWVVPVLAKPDISLGSLTTFQAVGARTQPTFRLDVQTDGGGYCGYAVPETATGGNRSADAGAPGVTVVDAQDVGPYSTVTLSSHNSQELLQWLDDNGFQQPAEALPLIEHYVQLNMFFVALRLKQDATAGDIQPIVLDMATSDPCVPLILTRIAAQPNMPVQVYTLGSARAFPQNWFHVQVNPARINWLQFGSNYRQVVTDAIDQAAGHGFVTEFAGSSALMAQVIYKPGQYDTTKLAGITDPAVLVQTLLTDGYPRDGTMKALLRKWIPMPQSVMDRGVTEQQFYNNVSAYQADLQAAGFVLNTAGFIADLQERVIMPLQQAQAMFDAQPYLTRLLSTVSPDEMTRDPIFTMNGELPDVSNQHVAHGFGTCQADGTIANLRIQLEDGQVLTFDSPVRLYGGPSWPYAGAGSPASRIELVGPTGQPVPVAAAQAASLDHALDTLPPNIVRAMAAAAAPPQASSSGCGCHIDAQPAPGLLLAGLGAALVGAVALGRRRHRR